MLDLTIKSARLVLLISIVMFQSCADGTRIVLPNGDDLTGKRIVDVKAKYFVDFHPYEGFKAYQNDKWFNSFILHIDADVGGQYDEERVKALENCEIKAIWFEAVPANKIGYHDFIKEMKQKFNGDRIRTISRTEAVILKGNVPLCKVEYMKAGVLHYRVSIGERPKPFF